jgi:hypothetical protein
MKKPNINIQIMNKMIKEILIGVLLGDAHIGRRIKLLFL